LLLSLLLAAIATILCLLLAYPLALILKSFQMNKSSFIIFIFILPMWMNFLLRTYAWKTLLSKNGLFDTLLGIDILKYPLRYRTGNGL
jgi:spermidine/putrescine transport system permease protein